MHLPPTPLDPLVYTIASFLLDLTLTEHHRLPVGLPQLESEYMGDPMGVTGILIGQWHAQLGILLIAQVTAWQGKPRKQSVG